MRDRDIRAALKTELDKQHAEDDSTLILDELGVCQGDARVDLAVINGSLAGFEIKSDRDTLARLPGQCAAYGQVFDFLTIVVGPKYAGTVETQIPTCWGITVATETSAGLHLDQLRPPGRNHEVRAGALAALLWRDEVLELLASRGLDAGLRSKPRRTLWAALAAGLELPELAYAVRETLKGRTRWRADPAPWPGGATSSPAATSSRSL